MGIFSFLSRKSHDKHKAASLRAHAYDTTAAGTVPLQGAYPVAGNGPNVFDTLSGGRPDSRHAQLSSTVPDNHNGAAPAPGVPRYRDPTTDRPNTAPSGQPTLQHVSSGTRLRKAAKKGPPISFKMLRSVGSTISGGSRPGSKGSEYEIKSTLQGTVSHSRSSSMRSESGRFRDILDAHSELKPPDFRARVKAAGAKDYGEDVAERNMGENGFDLESEHVKAFYNSHPSAPRPRRSAPALNPRSSRHTIREAQNGQQPPKRPMAPPPASIAPSQRSLPQALPGQTPRHKPAETALYADMKTTGGGHLKRRVSVNTYMPPASFQNTSAVSLSKVHGSEINTIDLDILKPPIVMGAPRTSGETPRTARIPRDSVMLARRKVSIPGHLARRDSSSPERTFSLRSATTRPQHHHQRASMSSSTSASFSPRHRHSLHTLHSSISSSGVQSWDGSSFLQGTTTTTTTTTTPLAYPRRLHTATQPFQPPSVSEVDVDAVDDWVEFCSSHKTASTTPKPTASSLANLGFRRPLSMMRSTPPPPPLNPPARPATAVPFEIPEHHVPIRTRSLRGYSASSGTPTTHTVTVRSSSSPGRPQSRTTVTSASVDDDSLAPEAVKLAEGEDDDGFNMDDHISSDEVDSVLGGGGKKPSGEGEEELLWKEEGYGGGGLMLPGLWEVFPEAKVKGSYDGIGDSFGPRGGGRRRRRRRRYVVDTGVEYGSSGDEGEGFGEERREEEEEEEEMVRGRGVVVGRVRGRGRRRGKLEGIYGEKEGSDADDEEGTPRGRRASVGSYYMELREKVGVGVIEEEKEVMGKVDAAAAVRMRKQVKCAERAAGGGRVRLRTGGEGAANIGVRRNKSVPVLCVEGEEYRG